MIVINNKNLSPSGVLYIGGKKYTHVFKGDKLIHPMQFTTDIQFEVTIGAEDVNKDIPLISMYNEEGTGYFSINTSDGFSDVEPIPPSVSRQVITTSGEVIDINDGAVVTKQWTTPGVYTVTIKTGSSVKGTKFTNLNPVPDDRIGFNVVDNPYITKLIKYQSATITELHYTFAGLSKCVPSPSFRIGTPYVTKMYATFYKFGDSSWKASPAASKSAWRFNPTLLESCDKVTDISGIFYGCQLQRIPQGFFDYFPNVTIAYDVFKRSALGVYAYTDYTLDQYLAENVDGTSFIPMNLLHQMSKLEVTEGMFNAMDITNRNTFGKTGENTENSLGYGNWCNLGIRISSEIFRNTKVKLAAFMFGKINQVAVAKNLFQYIAPYIEDIQGFLYDTNWVIQNTVCQSVYFGSASSFRVNDFLSNTTLKVEEVLLGEGQTTTFPNLRKLNNAFCSSSYSLGFNSVNDIWNVNTLDEAVLTAVRNAMPALEANPSVPASNGVPAVDGLSGAFYNLRIKDNVDGSQGGLTAEAYNIMNPSVMSY